ncbi:9161_t:CDS:2 [Paraglomus brasilianum]|uniref:Small ribosomal subunit protein bS18m n=1 Tax=Paraglomus brasilianum TaxID=144538 RepID=A0A9N9B277_9GLOM|nr:9161_t:CDS:2 [Paraglomus brasilianum]
MGYSSLASRALLRTGGPRITNTLQKRWITTDREEKSISAGGSQEKPFDSHEHILKILKESNMMTAILSHKELRGLLDINVSSSQGRHLYDPTSLSEEQPQGRYRPARRNISEDVFDVLSLDPLKEYKNFTILSAFVSDMGKILPRSRTGLTMKNQRKVALAIRRARSLGLVPSTHRRNIAAENSQFAVGIGLPELS